MVQPKTVVHRSRERTDVQDNHSNRQQEKDKLLKEKTSPLDRDVNKQQYRHSNESYGITHRKQSQSRTIAKHTKPSYNPTVELHKTKEEAIKEFVQQHGTIALDWYVPDFCNTRVGDLIKERLLLETTEGRILFSCPPLREFFKTSNFELDLRTGWVYTYLDPPEDIGISCQQEQFDPEFLTDILRGEHDTSMMHKEKLERIPRVKKIAGPADIMDQEEAEYKIRQYCHLWTLYAENSVKLKKKSELSQESTVTACKVYIPYISDILRQVDEVMKIFAMEKELRIIKNRGYFPVPQITPQDNKIETIQDKDKILEAVDEEVTAMLNAVKQSEENYAREQEQARVRDEQLRSARQTKRLDFNYLTLANSTPIRNDDARSDQPGIHFNTNPVHHIYSTTSDRDDQYEPPVNDSIIQGAGSALAGQFATNTTGATGCNDPWRCNNGTNTVTNTASHRASTRPTSHNGLHNNSPNSSDTRNGPTCFRCGEQGHMRSECRERVFCNNYKIYNHDTQACRKQHNNIPSPANSQITTGYHPTATPPPLMGTTTATQQAHQTGTHNNSPLFQNLFENNQPRASTMIHTLYNVASPAAPADIVEGLTQIMTQVANDNKRDDASKQMMKNIKIFNSSNKAECITWFSQVEVAARFTKTPFHELICQSMAPAMLHVFSELSALASDEDIKDAILTNYSDIPITTEAAT